MDVVGHKLDDGAWLDAAPRIDVMAETGRRRTKGFAFAIEIRIDDGNRLLRPHFGDEFADVQLLFG